MTAHRLVVSLTALALGLGAMSTIVQGNEDLQKQIQELQAQVKQLQSQRTYNAKDVEATVNSIIRDADNRSRFLADGGVSAGYIDDKFTIGSADGKFTLIPSIQFQFRNVTNLISPSQGDDQWTNGWEMRRLKFGLEGHVFTKDLTYNFVWATDRKNGTLVSEEAVIRYAFNPNWAVQLGQYKQLLFLETMTSSKRQTAVERSIVSENLLGGDTFSQGVILSFDNRQNLQAEVGFSDGYSSRNTNFQDHVPDRSFNADWGVHGRVSYKAFGDWKSYRDFSAHKNKGDLLVIGAGGDWTQSGDTDTFRHAIDAQYELGARLGLFAGYVGQLVRNPSGEDRYHWGVVAQIGYMLDPQWEVFGRYAFLNRDVDSGEDSFHETTLGVNYYLKGHAAKFTVDLGWLCNGIHTDLDGAGVLAAPGENEFYLRAQFQLLL